MKELSWHPAKTSPEHYYYQKIQNYLSKINNYKTSFSEMVEELVRHFMMVQKELDFNWKEQHNLLKSSITPTTGAPTIYKATINDSTYESVLILVSDFRRNLGVSRVNLGFIMRILSHYYYVTIVANDTIDSNEPTDSEILTLYATINRLLAEAIIKKDLKALQGIMKVLTEERKRNTNENI